MIIHLQNTRMFSASEAKSSGSSDRSTGEASGQGLREPPLVASAHVCSLDVVQTKHRILNSLPD